MPTSTLNGRRRLRAAALAGCLAAATLSGTGIAAAEGNPTIPYDTDHDSWESPHKCADQSEEFRFRFYFNSNYGGAWVNIGHNLSDLASLSIGGSGGGYVALSYCDKGKGAGQRVANNSASAYNWYRGYCATVHYNSGYRGATDRIYPNNGMNLSATYNNNKSINFDAC
ncbi:hypothetical protein [Streptomyces melanogenes]|uniref:hypothetical protein n=1 Tax=Streptomyces melanogenes TaxID=67326 RepID=UPI00378FD69D